MDVEEIIIETLKLVTHIELNHEGPPNIYTCLLRNPESDSIFNEVVLAGDVCVCAHTSQVATLLFYLMHGIFDHSTNRLKWYTKVLEKVYYDDITPEVAVEIWTNYYESIAEIKKHNITQSIIIYPTESTIVNMTPGTCDIWTIPRVRRQFND